jgi:hypothetical protein
VKKSQPPVKIEQRQICTHAGEGAVVPKIALVGEAVAHVAQLALLDILLDGVEEFLLGDLAESAVSSIVE